MTHDSDPDSDDKDHVSRLRSRTFIYRTRKGKKIKTNEIMMQTIGAMIESASEEESEVTKEYTRKQLKHARAVIEDKMTQQSMAELSLISDT